MKKHIILMLLAVFVFFGAIGCGPQSGQKDLNGARQMQSAAYETLQTQPPERVVALGASLAEVWLLAGGKLAGVTSDIREQEIDAGDAQIIGTMRDPNIEQIVALSPDLVLLSPDIPSHREAAETFKAAGISCFAAKNDSLEDYLALLDAFTTRTGHKEFNREYGDAVAGRVRAVLEKVPQHDEKTVLFLRASSTDVKAKSRDNATCDMLRALGTVNIADVDGALLEQIGMEAVLAADPDYIFVVTMGSDTQKAEQTLKAALTDNPAWSSLSAVREGRFEMLPKELFHYKPNARWGEAYEYLYEKLYGV